MRMAIWAEQATATLDVSKGRAMNRDVRYAKAADGTPVVLSVSP
jgi:hypothetical protein